MRKIIVLTALGMAIAATPALAQKNSQQEVMKSCNVSASGKKGDERKAFMKSCLSDGRKAQQEKMKTCNADAGKQGLKGDERKKFMSSCLSAKKDAAVPAAAQPAPAAAAPALSPKEAQQQKMKTCNADAAKQELKGDDRKKFMSECLKAGTK